MKMIILQDILYVSLLIGLSIPLGIYICKVMTGQNVFLTRMLAPVEYGIYKLMGVKSDEEMGAKRYALSVLIFSGIGFIFLWLMQMLQGVLPFHEAGIKGTSWHLAFNTAASFVTNTNWQAYSGETGLTYFTQFTGLTVQNFVSAATGIAVVFALIRGFASKEKKTIGSFWVDLTRTTLYVLLPLSMILAIVLVSQGVVQTFGPYKEVAMLENGGVQTIPLGPAASQIAIKQEATPETKLALIRDYQLKGHLVAMTGDGTNDAPALAQADVAVAMNSGTQAAKEAGNMVDLDSSPTKLIDIVRIGKQLLMTRGSLTTFSVANDVAKYFAIIPVLFFGIYPQLAALNFMGLTSSKTAILSAIIYNALIIIALIPLALKGVKYRELPAGKLLKRNMLIYGLGGITAPFIAIKLIDMLLTAGKIV